jgi:hypothetical protein
MPMPKSIKGLISEEVVEGKYHIRFNKGVGI